MHEYGVRDVEKLLGLPRSTIRSLIVAGFVSPARGARNAWRFSFQDLIVLRTARALAVANVPSKRITRSMRELRRHLPKSMPLSGLSICAVADHVVVREGGSRWQADSGQYLLAFESDADGTLSVIEQMSAQPEASAESHFADGAALENEDADAAVKPTSMPSQQIRRWSMRISIWDGCCTKVAGTRMPSASIAMRSRFAAMSRCCLFNLGVLLDDRGRKSDAIQTYEAALSIDPALADCHYNLALLYEDVKKPKNAIRHMAQYRRLIRTRSR